MNHLLLIVFAAFGGAYWSSAGAVFRMGEDSPRFLSSPAGQFFQLISMILTIAAGIGILLFGFKELKWYWVLVDLLGGYVIISNLVEKLFGTLVSFYFAWIPAVASGMIGFGRRFAWF